MWCIEENEVDDMKTVFWQKSFKNERQKHEANPNVRMSNSYIISCQRD